MTTVTLPIIHFNDVYNMTGSTNNQKVMENGKLTRANFESVVRFAESVNRIRGRWATEGAKKVKKARESGDIEQEEAVEYGLVLFSGDLFSPSVESILSKGSNMFHLMNELAPDACVPGNHEFDFGRERFSQLAELSNYDWILSNVRELPRKVKSKEDKPKQDDSKKEEPKEDAKQEGPKEEDPKKVDSNTKGELLRGVREYSVFKRSGLVIGVIGVMSEDAWSSTLSAAKEGCKFEEMKETCTRLSRHLRKRKEDGGEGCDIVLALTHATHKEDVALGKLVNAYPSTKKEGLEDLEGIDAIFGGHDHTYFLGAGVELQNASSRLKPQNTEKDDDGLLIVKSDYDFNDFSHATLELEKQPEGKHRKYVIKSLKVVRHHMAAEIESASTQAIKRLPAWKVLHRIFQREVMRGLEVPVAKLPQKLEFFSEDARKYETAIGNWLTDTILEAYLVMKLIESEGENKGISEGESDALLEPTIFIMTGGSIRSNGLPAVCRARDIIGLLPFPSTLVSLELKGEDIVKALEGALSQSGTGDQAPKSKTKKSARGPTEPGVTSSGRFPVFSGLRVEWDSTQPKGSRVTKVLAFSAGDWEPIKADSKYCVLTNDYLAEGNIGFESFKSATKSSRSDLPVFQVLLNYIETMYFFLYLPIAVPELYSDEDKKRRFEERLAEIGEAESTSKQALINYRDSMKRAIAAICDRSLDSLIPLIEIKPVDPTNLRMKDVSKH